MANPSTASVASGDPLSLVIGATACQVIGGLVPQMSPFVVAGLIDGLALSERDAGIVASVELLALAVSAILIAPVLPRLSYRRAGMSALVLTVAAQAASIVSDGWTSLVLLRGAAGIGEGALYAMSLSLVASHCCNPVKTFGLFQLVWAIGSVVLFGIGGEVTAAYGHRGIFALLAGLTLGLSPFLLLIPDLRALKQTATRTPPSVPLLGSLLFAAIVLYVAVSAGLFAFSGPMGERIGLDTAAVGYILTLSTVVGLAGAGAATALNVRWGRAVPISAFCLGYVVVALVLCLWTNPLAYSVAVILSAVLYYFSLPYLFGLAAALDQSGRWAAAAGSAYLLGFAAGPVFTGAVIAASGYASLATVCVTMTIVAWALAVSIVARAFHGDRLADRLRNSAT